MYQPLAEILRPKALDEVVGQSHLIGENKPLSILANGKPQSIILWGPPGVGKTTIANILTAMWDCEVIKLSAIFSGIKEIKEALELATKNYSGLLNRQTVLFIDEIHRFNKAQQDAFLHHLEEGKIILIGATTENPSFELNNALLSRMQVYILNPLTKADLSKLLDTALHSISNTIKKANATNLLADDARELVLDLADGDARRLLNIIETIANSGKVLIKREELKQILPNSLKRFDKGGEEFYNQISALHKAVRGSDPDAALYWFMRMIDSGADPLYLGRRVLRMTWEDIGLADTNAATIALNALQTYERLGSPEGELAIANAIIYLAVTPKSNAAYVAYKKVHKFVEKTGSKEVPIHLRNAPTKLMSELGYGKEYKYAHDYPEHYVPNENYWPDGIAKEKFYEPTNQGLEKRVVDRLEFLNNLDKTENNH
ncbi:MAG: recombination factor protein RarA [Burkholderiales bacterium]|jgi:putative ATPase|nr:recombination factor protein RarA [Burkholderiales bacterium]